jgi:hypothetical protein
MVKHPGRGCDVRCSLPAARGDGTQPYALRVRAAASIAQAINPDR